MDEYGGIMINSFRGEYFFLSNFYAAPVTYDGITYQNNEAAFQAQKACNREVQKSFSVMSPAEAKHFGRRINSGVM